MTPIVETRRDAAFFAFARVMLLSAFDGADSRDNLRREIVAIFLVRTAAATVSAEILSLRRGYVALFTVS